MEKVVAVNAVVMVVWAARDVLGLENLGEVLGAIYAVVVRPLLKRLLPVKENNAQRYIPAAAVATNTVAHNHDQLKLSRARRHTHGLLKHGVQYFDEVQQHGARHRCSAPGMECQTSVRGGHGDA